MKDTLFLIGATLGFIILLTIFLVQISNLEPEPKVELLPQVTLNETKGIFVADDVAPYLSVDVQGRLKFTCIKCPNKFCKEMACIMTSVPKRFNARCTCL